MLIPVHLSTVWRLEAGSTAQECGRGGQMVPADSCGWLLRPQKYPKAEHPLPHRRAAQGAPGPHQRSPPPGVRPEAAEGSMGKSEGTRWSCLKDNKPNYKASPHRQGSCERLWPGNWGTVGNTAETPPQSWPPLGGSRPGNNPCCSNGCMSTRVPGDALRRELEDAGLTGWSEEVSEGRPETARGSVVQEEQTASAKALW